MELAIPFSDLSVTPGGAEIFRINMARERYTDPIERSCLRAGSRGFIDKSRFVNFRPAAADATAPIPFYIQSIGVQQTASAVFMHSGDMDLRGCLLEFELLDTKQKSLVKYPLKLEPNKPTHVDYYIESGRTTALKWALKDTKDGAYIYSNRGIKLG